ncbi:MAG: Asp-tRNA(Asn)/Glu-tRNA(Gln) amidotransferase subunit GatB [Candidatus Omnitrophica bacterium]|nr:Asp-tRNA(Asn)/Glu-tRNA(Gln) amidotransferase subunit GatB [Candidatus Omnitrophota bacterium]
MKYDIVIGLEVHLQLNTKTKIFCGCSTTFGNSPNSQTCPVCLGFPGVLPVFNKGVLDLSLRSALALGCTVSKFIKFDRKNYFYPDLPKNFQISQYDLPLAKDGLLEIDVEDGSRKRIRIRRVHMEEDAGKLVHEKEASLVDFNRCGTPLLEIVSEPDINSPEEAYRYLTALKEILRYLEVSDCNMEEGSLRCDANISLKPKGSEELGTKAEVKNVNSFKAVRGALSYEVQRQEELLSNSERVVQETRLWDPDKEVTVSMRSKEEAHDYRYFPEPDLVPFVITDKTIQEVRSALPELPQAKRARFIKEIGLSEYDAGVITSEKEMADYFEGCIKLYDKPKVVANWLMGDFTAALKEKGLESISQCEMDPADFIGMLKMIDDGSISGKMAKSILAEAIQEGKAPKDLVSAKGLTQISDKPQLEDLVGKAMEENGEVVEEYRRGKKGAIAYLVGQVMQKTKGKANPKLVNEILRKKLEG